MSAISRSHPLNAWLLLPMLLCKTPTVASLPQETAQPPSAPDGWLRRRCTPLQPRTRALAWVARSVSTTAAC